MLSSMPTVNSKLFKKTKHRSTTWERGFAGKTGIPTLPVVQEAFSASPDIPPSQPGRDRGSCRSLPHRSDSGAPSRARPVFAHRDVVGPCSAASWIDHYASTGFLGTAVCDVVTSRQRHSSGTGMVTANADVPQQGRAPRWRRLPLHGTT